MNIKVSPSLLAADQLRLGEEIKRVDKAGADMLHIDVMDGVYVPNIACPLAIVSAADKITELPLDVHMMTVCPGKYVERLAEFGADYVTVHNDIAPYDEVVAILRDIRAHGMKAGIAVSPDVPASEAIKFLPYVDLVLVMTVQPGFGGQKFRDMSEKIALIRDAAKGKYDIDIEVDGGINKETAKLVVAAGANLLVAGTSVFGAEDASAAICDIKNSDK